MNNYIPGSSYPTHLHSPVSSSSHYNDYNNNNHNHHNNYNGNGGGGGGNNGGFLDDMGYAVTPSAVTVNNDYNRPQSAPSRPSSSGYNDYQDDGNGYSYGSYQGKKRI